MPFFSPSNVFYINRHTSSNKSTHWVANTTVLRIECCHQFTNVEKTGIVKRKINFSTRPYSFTFLLSVLRTYSFHQKYPSTTYFYYIGHILFRETSFVSHFSSKKDLKKHLKMTSNSSIPGKFLRNI